MMSRRNCHSTPSVLYEIRAQETHISPLPWKPTYATSLAMPRSTCKYCCWSSSSGAMIHAPVVENIHLLKGRHRITFLLKNPSKIMQPQSLKFLSNFNQVKNQILILFTTHRKSQLSSSQRVLSNIMTG